MAKEILKKLKGEKEEKVEVKVEEKKVTSELNPDIPESKQREYR